jgi:8-oxo-dGTP pyrophosphatase MutT (NUDIX family)
MVEVTICLLVKGNPPTQLLLGWKKTGLGQGKYAGLGGKVEAGETREVAAIRELHEEAGVIVSSDDLEYLGQLNFLFPSKPEWDELAHVFLVRKWDGEPVETREMRPTWFAPDQVPYGGMWDDYRYWLPRALQGRSVTARFVYAQDNETVHTVEGDLA